MWQEYTGELYKKELQDPHNHDDVITHLEPDILECEVKRALKTITMNKVNLYFCFIDYTKAFDCVDHNKLWEILQEMGIPDHLTCLQRNLHAVRKQ